jgi:hypothetical protein
MLLTSWSTTGKFHFDAVEMLATYSIAFTRKSEEAAQRVQYQIRPQFPKDTELCTNSYVCPIITEPVSTVRSLMEPQSLWQLASGGGRDDWPGEAAYRSMTPLTNKACLAPDKICSSFSFVYPIPVVAPDFFPWSTGGDLTPV